MWSRSCAVRPQYGQFPPTVLPVLCSEVVARAAGEGLAGTHAMAVRDIAHQLRETEAAKRRLEACPVLPLFPRWHSRLGSKPTSQPGGACILELTPIGNQPS